MEILGLDPKVIKVYQNIKWVNHQKTNLSTVGEIDMILFNLESGKIEYLIECKSNIFDTSHAYR